MADSLDVYLCGSMVATITRRGDNLTLRYLEDYVQTDQAIPISTQLPVVAGVAPAEKTKRFLENLLPDRPDVRERWARKAGLDNASAFDLLSVYGADVAGALEFYPAGIGRRSSAGVSPVSDEGIAERIRQIRIDDTNWLQRHPIEEGFSLGGAQGKFALARIANQWFEPTGQQPSTHIFKPGVRNLDGSDITEHITMQVARLLDLDVANTEILQFNGEHVLVVERFDRVFQDGHLVRLHQEDLAQATGTSYLKKYERDAGPTYLDIFAVFDRDLDPKRAREAKKRFAECLVFSWIIGHNDGHSKNYSITHLPEESYLSPFYDLNTALVFALPEAVLAKNYEVYDSFELAFTVGGASTIGEFGAASLRTLELDAHLPADSLLVFALYVAANLQAVVAKVIEALPGHMQDIPSVGLYPYATFAQTRRVVDLLADSL